MTPPMVTDATATEWGKRERNDYWGDKPLASLLADRKRWMALAAQVVSGTKCAGCAAEAKALLEEAHGER